MMPDIVMNMEKRLLRVFADRNLVTVSGYCFDNIDD